MDLTITAAFAQVLVRSTKQCLLDHGWWSTRSQQCDEVDFTSAGCHRRALHDLLVTLDLLDQIKRPDRDDLI